MSGCSRSSTDFSSAQKTSFRSEALGSANIRFVESSSPTPTSVSELIALLEHWTWPHASINETGPLPHADLSEDEARELQAAVELARQIPRSLIDRYADKPESEWKSDVNYLLLGPLRTARAYDQLSGSQDYPWNQGKHLCPTTPLHDPQPDLAWGVPLDESPDSALSLHVLKALRDALQIRSKSD